MFRKSKPDAAGALNGERRIVFFFFVGVVLEGEEILSASNRFGRCAA